LPGLPRVLKRRSGVIGQDGQDFPTITDEGPCVIRRIAGLLDIRIWLSFEKICSYLCVLGGMGYAGGPIAGLGGGGMGGVPVQTLHLPPLPHILSSMHHTAGADSLERRLTCTQ
jgi:hypothetical protein